MATVRVAAGALMLDERGHVLMAQPTYKAHWDIPGGYVEADESPLRACEREVHEELGLTAVLGALLVVDWATAEDEGDKLLFIFDGGTISIVELAEVFQAGDEIDGWEFVRPDELDRRAPDRLVRRLLAALDARQLGATAYAEHGRHVR